MSITPPVKRRCPECRAELDYWLNEIGMLAGEQPMPRWYCRTCDLPWRLEDFEEAGA